MDTFSWRKLSSSQKKMWAVAGGVMVFGTAIKFGYFVISRGLILDSIENRHIKARNHLKEAQEYGTWAAQDRQKRAPPLTDEQRQQLQNYLALMAQNNKDVYPISPKTK